MKNKFAILPILLCIGPMVAVASECDGDGCDLDVTVTDVIEQEAAPDFTQNVRIDMDADGPRVSITQSDMNLYNEIMQDAAATRARLDEMLTPAFGCNQIRPMNMFDGCPFATQRECDIWQKKPVVNENVSPQAIKAMSLMKRYKLLMRFSNACCTTGVVNALHDNDESDGMIYKVLVDDVNFYGFTERCLVESDDEIMQNHGRDITPDTMLNIRNECICRNREWIYAILGPFTRTYYTAQPIVASPLYYTYTDGVGRTVNVSINDDVQQVLYQLSQCP